MTRQDDLNLRDWIERESQIGPPADGFVSALLRLGETLRHPDDVEAGKLRESAVNRMHERRNDFVESTSKHYTRHVVAIAGGCYLIRYVGEGTILGTSSSDASGVPSFLLSAATLAGYWLLIGTYIWICRRLLETNYLMYSSSAVTAAAHSLAGGQWDHAWFDLVFRAAQDLDNVGHQSPEFALSKRKLSPTMSWKELLASHWSSGPNSLLSLHKKIHLGLAMLCYAMAVVCVAAIWLGVAMR